MTWRRVARVHWALAGVWALVAAGALALRPAVPALARYSPDCWLRSLTGVPCATCGSTHAAVALAEGRWLDALGANPLAAVAAALFVAGGLAAPLWLAAFRRVPDVPRVPPLPWRLAAGAALAGNWIFVILRSR
jgi:hypothetical protein